MAKKKKQTEELHPIDAAYEEISKEYKQYRKAKVDYYSEQGVEIDLASHEPHWQKVFLMGKVYMLTEAQKPTETKTTKAKVTKAKGSKNVKSTKKAGSTRKKSTRKKSTKRATGGQLQLGV